MYTKALQVYLLTALCATVSGVIRWDVAVVIQDRIEYLDKNGTLEGITYHNFEKLKSITYNGLRRQVIVGDVDVIYSVNLSHKSEPKPIIKNLSRNVKTIGVDEISGIMYWTDHDEQKIMMMSLQNESAESEVLFQFEDKSLFGIAVDTCERKLYWTNMDYNNATIERSNLDGTEHEILLWKNLEMPASITIDHVNKRLYWIDMGRGSYFSVQSSGLDGQDHKIVYSGRRQHPYAISLDKDYIYWTDLANEAVWALPNNGSNVEPKLFRKFKENPMGIIAKTNFDIAACTNIKLNVNRVSSEDQFEPAVDSIECLNFGELTEHGCRCHRGFVGVRCEVNLCHNYCNNGECYVSPDNFPQCNCSVGFLGARCEYDVCQRYCMNGATCTALANSTETPAKCDCPPGFIGNRCEQVVEKEMICQMLCPKGGVFLYLDGETPSCRCDSERDSNALVQDDEAASPLEQKFKDPLVLGFMFAMFVLITAIIVLSMTVCRLKRRPRIKKRIIVNKNVTPLTCRPNQPTEQCEITIENCCNMNICETPCFEPSQIHGGFQCPKADESKGLLPNMENGGDLY